jgi:hypothetical protein
MKKIKFLKTQLIRIDGVLYTPYLVGDLTPTFGFINNADKDQQGIPEFFNYKGFTYIRK